MNPKKQHKQSRKLKTLKLTVVDFVSSTQSSSSNLNNCNTSNNSCNSGNSIEKVGGLNESKVMTSKYTEYFSNNVKPFQVISFPFKSNTKQQRTIRKKRLQHRNDKNHDEMANLHQDGPSESSPPTPTQQQQHDTTTSQRPIRTSISIRELLNYD